MKSQGKVRRTRNGRKVGNVDLILRESLPGKKQTNVKGPPKGKA